MEIFSWGMLVHVFTMDLLIFVVCVVRFAAVAYMKFPRMEFQVPPFIGYAFKVFPISSSAGKEQEGCGERFSDI